jgi:pyruvate dehydrogenase E1 component beta subunit
MLNMKGELDTGSEPVELGKALTVREGSDVTVVATQLMRARAEAAAAALAEEGVEVELIDPRTVLPIDFEAIFTSLEKTNRILVVQESPAAGSWGATVVAELSRQRFESLDAAPAMLSGDDTPVPYAGALEQAWLIDEERIAAAVRDLLQA